MVSPIAEGVIIMRASNTNPNADDQVVPFQVEHVEASGRLVRLGPAIDEILVRHAYPDKVSEILGQALLLVAMFGSMIKDRQSGELIEDDAEFEKPSKERFILQTQSDGPVSLIVADYVHPGRLRGYARFDKSHFENLDKTDQNDNLLGKGHLAMTIDRGSDTDRYQGIVALDDEGPNAGLSGAANLYFEQSEQLPTFILLAMAKHFDAMNVKNDNSSSDWQWRGGALMVQKLTSVGGHKTKDLSEHDVYDDDDSWNRALILSQTIKDHELLDPLLSSRDLLYRLYHEDGIRVFAPMTIEATCSCSLAGVTQMLAGFSVADQHDMIEEDGKVHITCEFCNRAYELLPTDQTKA